MSEDTEQNNKIVCDEGYVIYLDDNGNVICPELEQYINKNDSTWSDVDFYIISDDDDDNNYIIGYHYNKAYDDTTVYKDIDNFQLNPGSYKVWLVISGYDLDTSNYIVDDTFTIKPIPNGE